MKKKSLVLAIAAAFALFTAIIIIIYFTRAPLLIVTEQSFASLYGSERFRGNIMKASLSLMRRIKIVEIANDAGDDVVRFAVEDVSARPFCVLFPRRFTRSANIYSEQNPDIRVVILEGRYPDVLSTDTGRENYFTYSTDIESDFYKTGIAAAIFADNMRGDIAVFIEPGQYLRYGSMAREAFLQGVSDQGGTQRTYFYTGLSYLPENVEIACAVVAGSGWEFLDRKLGIPVILFTWMDLPMVPADVVMIVDDSPVAQINQAAAFISAGDTAGKMQSRFYVFRRSGIDSRILQKIKNIGKNVEIM
ncbi:MAG: hypothetical protein FWC06_04905 [Treponema sp.]|nr:hypothetical protein [Treponema sp.]